MILRARDEELAVDAGAEAARNEVPETRPAGAAVELHVGREEGKVAARAVESASALFVIERRGERTLGVVLAQHGEGGGREAGFPVLFAERAPLVIGILGRRGGAGLGRAAGTGGEKGGGAGGEEEAAGEDGLGHACNTHRQPWWFNSTRRDPHSAARIMASIRWIQSIQALRPLSVRNTRVCGFLPTKRFSWVT